MNKQIKKQWVSALRSGQYKQGKGKLCYGNQNGTKYCCLGVLSDLAVKNGVCSRRTAFSENRLLNNPVMKWSGLDNRDPKIKYEGDYDCVSRLNDEKNLNFDQIAQLIEKQL